MRGLSTGALLSLAIVSTAAPGRGEEPPLSLDGEWEIVGMVYKGAVQKFGRPTGGTMTIRGRELVLKYGPDGAGAQVEITLRAGKGPKEIDYQFRGTETPHLGIFELADGTLTLVLAAGGQDRPKQFDATKDATLTSYTLRRVKR